MANRLTRNVSLTPELEAFIADCLESGDYGSASEVVRAALRSLRTLPRNLKTNSPNWPIGGGECGRQIRGKAWELTPFGRKDDWSAELRTTVGNIVNTPVAKGLIWGHDHALIYNDAFAKFIAGFHPDALGDNLEEVWPDMWELARDMVTAGMEGERSSLSGQTLAVPRYDRLTEVTLDLHFTPVYEFDGTVGGVMCTVADNTIHIAMEERLSESEAKLRRITDAAPMLISYVDRQHVYRFANQAYEDWFGTKADEMVGRHIRDVIGDRPYEERRGDIDRALEGMNITAETDMPRHDGPPRRIEIRYVPHVEQDGAVPGVYILGIDIDDRASREAAIALSNSRFRTAMDAVHGVLWTNSADGRMVGEQPGWAALTGQTYDDYQGFGWAKAVHPEDMEASIATWNDAVASRSMYVHEHRVRRHDGIWRRFSIRALPILGSDGDILEWVGMHTDITHQRAAEEALRDQAEMLARQVRHRERAEEQLKQLNENLEVRVIAEISERRQAEAQLAQAQKLETIGKLTGGVAHDFNNLLQVVSGNLQLLSKEVVGNERAETKIANAMAGVSRGAKLASQLLAFGRRQALDPKVVNIARAVRDMDDMIRRAIGEAIEVETVVGGGLWNTFIDRAQIENALLNLAINARDAMGGSGKLTIELANAHLDDTYARNHDEVSPGQYVMMAVTDTGVGMSTELLEKVFEPFFSTKEEGKGSGLGLSMVYGFVKQSGGHVKIYSEPGHGTCVKVYLPRAVEAEDVEVAVDRGPIVGGSETVLVVEDDEEVRETVVAMLSDLGYRTLKATDATSALSVIDSGITIDVLFTDVVMPGALKSPELARKSKERLPKLAVLFTSGYTENSIVHGGRLDAGVELLSKPYTREALARKIRHVISNQIHKNAVAPRVDNSETEVLPLVEMPEARLSNGDAASRTVLLVEDDGIIRMNTAEMLQDSGLVVVEAASAEEAKAALQTMAVDVLVTDVNLPGASGRELAAAARALQPSVLIVYATGDPASVRDEADAVILSKPYDAALLAKAVSRRSATDDDTEGSKSQISGEQEHI